MPPPARSSTGFRARAARPRRSTSPSAREGSRVDLALYIDVPTDDLVARMASRRICAANGHVYNVASNPPTVPGICDLDGSELVQREDDREETVRARMAQQIPPLLEVVDHYRATGVLRTIDGLRPIADVTARLLAELDDGESGAA